MSRKIIILCLLLMATGGTSAFATVDFVMENKLQQDLAGVEDLFARRRWDEVISRSRDIMKQTAADHPLRRRTLDLITLAIDHRNRETMQAEKKERVQIGKKDAELLVTEAATLIGEKKYQEALERLQRAANAYGADAETHFLIGYVNQSLKNLPEAYVSYRNCVRLNPEHPRALFHLSKLSFSLKRFDDAETYAKKIIGFMNQRLQELKNLGYEQKVAGLNDKALATARKMAAMKRNLAQTYYMFGLLVERRERWEEARDAFQASANLNSQPMEVYFHLGQANFRLNKLHSAHQAFDQCLFIGETILKEETMKGKKLLDEGKTDDAVAAELKVKALKKRLAMARYAHAVCSWKRRDMDAGWESIGKALQYDPEYTPARFAKALFMAESHEYQTAMYEIRKILKASKPNSPEAKRAINLLKILMERSMNEVAGKPIKPPERIATQAISVSEYVKFTPGLGGRQTEAEWDKILPVLREVRELLQRQNVPTAIRRLLHLKINFPNCVQVHAILGQCYFQEGRLDDAADSFKRALALNPREAESMANLAYIYALRGEKLDKALVMAGAALKQDANRAEFYHTRGWIYFRMGEVDKSITDLQAALQLRGNYPLARYNLGLAYYLSGSFELALNTFEQVLSQDPGNDKAALFKALTLAKLRRSDDAIKSLAELKKSLPEKETLVKVVANLHDKLKYAQERHEDLEPKLPVIKHFAPIETLMKKAREFRNYGLVTRAKEVYLECQRLNPRAFEPFYELGAMYAEAGLHVPAMKVWEQALVLNPNSYELQLNLGKMQYKIQNRARAQIALAKAEGLRPLDPEPSYYLGLIAYEEQRYESAESYALQAIRLKPRFFKALALLGMTRIRQGRYVQARDAYETIYSYAPADAAIRRHARKKLWEITKLMAPDAAPSFADAERKKTYLIERAMDGVEANGKRAPKAPIKPAKPSLDRLTTREKILVVSKLSEFEHYPAPSDAKPVKKAQRAEAQKNHIQNRMEHFKVAKKLYPAPAPMMSSKYTLYNRPPPPRPPDEADPFLKAGLQSVERGFLKEALASFEKGREVSPKNLHVLLNIGFLQTLNGNFKDAFDLFSEAVQEHPNEPLARIALGNLYWLGGKGRPAVEQWSFVTDEVKLDKEMSLISRSEKSWKKFIDMNPGDADGRTNLGIVYLFSDRPMEAVKEFKAALEMEPEKLENSFYQAACYVQTFLKTKKNVTKKEAREALVALAAQMPPFPHAGALLAFVNSL